MGAGSEQEEGARGGRHGSGGRTMKRSGNGTLRVEAPAAAAAANGDGWRWRWRGAGEMRGGSQVQRKEAKLRKMPSVGILGFRAYGAGKKRKKREGDLKGEEAKA